MFHERGGYRDNAEVNCFAIGRQIRVTREIKNFSRGRIDWDDVARRVKMRLSVSESINIFQEKILWIAKKATFLCHRINKAQLFGE